MPSASAAQPQDPFNLSMEEVRIIVKYRSLSAHQRKGVVQAIDLLRPSQPRPLHKRRSHR